MSDPALGSLPGDLRGRHAVVTGAGHGIGEAIARLLLQAGAEVLAVDRSATALARAFNTGECETVEAELSDREELFRLADRLASASDPVDIIVNNVATAAGRQFLDLTPDDFDHTTNTNLFGPWFLTKRLVSRLIADGRPGSILFISSLHDTFVRLLPDYSATKAGAAMLTRELAFELAPCQIRVNAISPGWIETAKEGEPPIARQDAIQLIPAARFGDPYDVARIALVLLSDAWSGYVTGVNWSVDGGLALHNWLMDG